MPYQIATLLYCFNEQDEVLLLQRAREPNRGLWSPCGGKLHTETGESPYACACREAEEELGLQIEPTSLHLTGIVSEAVGVHPSSVAALRRVDASACPGGDMLKHELQPEAHWLMFLFELRARLSALPKAHREGEFRFFRREELDQLPLPQTDREQIWPLFWKYRGGFFAAHCHCHPGGRNEWTLEETVHA